MNVSVRFMKMLTVAYLSFSFFVFFVGWLKIPYAILSCCALGYGIAYYYYYITVGDKFYFPYWKIGLILGIIFLWLAFSGAGGFGYQYSDYYKHNALTKDFMLHNWPISYQVKGQQMYLAHYLGYYLQAEIFQVFGWKAVQLGQFCFTFLALVLGFFWMLRLLKSNHFFWVIMVLFMGGASFIPMFMEHGFDILSVIIDKIKNHGLVFDYSSMGVSRITYLTFSDTIFWAISHGMGNVLCTSLLLNDLLIDRETKFSPFVASLLVFYAPLVLVGLAPILAFAIYKTNIKEVFNRLNLIVAPIVFFFVATFILSIDAGSLIQNFLFNNRTAEGITFGQQLGSYLHFLLFEVYIWMLPIFWILWKKSKGVERGLLILITTLLTIIPLYRYGLWNDWCTRVSMPSLLMMYIFACKAIKYGTLKQKTVMIAVWFMGTVGPTISLVGSIRHSGYTIKWSPPEYAFVGDVPSICVGFPVEQFVAKPNTFFFKHLAKDTPTK